MLVILDSNVLLSALISPYGAPATIYEAWRDHKFELVTCELQRTEIRRASQYPKLKTILKPHLVGKMLNFMHHARFIEDVPRRHSLRDPSDAFLLDLAEFAEADYLVTGDKRAGLLVLERLRRTRIFGVSDFCHTVLGK